MTSVKRSLSPSPTWLLLRAIPFFQIHWVFFIFSCWNSVFCYLWLWFILFFTQALDFARICYTSPPWWNNLQIYYFIMRDLADLKEEIGIRLPSFCLLQCQLLLKFNIPLIPKDAFLCAAWCQDKKKTLSWDRNIFLVCHVRKGSLSASMHFLSQCEMWEYLWNSMCNGGKSPKDTRHFV